MFIKFVMFTNESFKLSFSMMPNHGNIICVPPPQPMFFKEIEREKERQRERERVRVGNTKSNYRKERGFDCYCFISLKICIRLRTYYNLSLLPKYPFSYFSLSLEFYLRVLFPWDYP